MKPSPRRKARELAVQAVYSWQISQNSVSDVEVGFITDNSKRRFDIEYFQQLLRGVTSNISSIDLAITPHVDRPIDDIDQVEKAILPRKNLYFYLQHKRYKLPQVLKEHLYDKELIFLLPRVLGK